MARRPRHDTVPSPRGTAAPARPPRLHAPHPLLAALALFLVVAGTRWWLVGQYATDLPWLDQWDAEAQGIYQPLHAGTLSIAAWFAPHNEHRIFFTRILAAALLRLNHQWDPRLQMAVNAALYALIPAVLFLVLRRDRPPAFQVFCWVLLAVLGCAPYAATNTLLGFQSQFYFLAGFSLVCMWLLVNSRPGSLAWIGGILAGFAALFSMGSGYAAAIAVLGVLVAAALRKTKEFPYWARANAPTLVAAAAIVGAGILLRASAPESAAFAARSAGDFAGFLVGCLSWPGSPALLLAFVTWIPFFAFAALYLRARTPDDAAARFVLGIGFWVLLQAAALALYRANSGEGIESRYTDILAFGLLANALAAVWFLNLRRWAPVAAAVWFAVSGFGLYTASSTATAASWKEAMEIRRAATAGYLATGDRRYLDQAPPHPDTARVAALLQDPGLRPILPAGIRPALALTPVNGSPAPQMVNGLSMPDLRAVPPGVWTFPGLFTRFAMVPASARFEYRVSNAGALPFLLLYTIGDGYQLASPLTVRLPGGGGQGQPAITRCRGECALSGTAGSSPLALMEPKEIGLLSVAALFAVLWGPYVAAAGVLLFLVLVFAPRLRPRRASRTSA